MGLKNFHVFFIVLSTMLCLFVGFWSVGEWRSGGEAWALAFAIVSFAAAFGLVTYGTWFLKKSKEVPR